MRLPLLLAAGLRHHVRHPLQSALAMAGIALGVALWVAVRGSLGSAEAAFERAAATLAGHATHVLRGGLQSRCDCYQGVTLSKYKSAYLLRPSP